MKNSLEIKIPNTYKNYLKFISGITNLTNREIDLLGIMYSLNIKELHSSNKHILSDKLDISKKTLNIMINTLYKKKILNRVKHGRYTLHTIVKDIKNLNIIFDG